MTQFNVFDKRKGKVVATCKKASRAFRLADLLNAKNELNKRYNVKREEK